MPGVAQLTGRVPRGDEAGAALGVVRYDFKIRPKCPTQFAAQIRLPCRKEIPDQHPGAG
jgi:hypothetical protein